MNQYIFVIMHRGEVWFNRYFLNVDECRNFIKMQYPKRRFKEPMPDKFVCARYGTTFEIVTLYK